MQVLGIWLLWLCRNLAEKTCWFEHLMDDFEYQWSREIFLALS